MFLTLRAYFTLIKTASITDNSVMDAISYACDLFSFYCMWNQNAYYFLINSNSTGIEASTFSPFSDFIAASTAF